MIGGCIRNVGVLGLDLGLGGAILPRAEVMGAGGFITGAGATVAVWMRGDNGLVCGCDSLTGDASLAVV